MQSGERIQNQLTAFANKNVVLTIPILIKTIPKRDLLEYLHKRYGDVNAN